MTGSKVAHVRDLTRRLSEAEATIEALLSGQIDAVVDSKSMTPVLLGKAQQALRESEERYRRIVETTNEGIGTTDTESNITFVNRRLAEMLGYRADEMLGKSLSQFMPEAARADVALRAEQSPHGIPEEGEVEFVRKDGSELWTLLKTSPRRDSDGKHLGTLAMMTDRTQHRQAEEALRKSEAHLRQAQKMEAIGELAGGIAHDFNNLLSVVLSYSELLAADLKEGDPMRDELGEIQGAGLRALDLTRQLLAFSRQQVLQPKIVDLSQIAGGMEKMLRRLIGEDVELSVAFAPALGKIMVDPGQMEQVIMNLSVNARDAMPRGGKLTIETAEVILDETFASEHVGVTSGPHVMLAVSDTGIGMDRATQARMFEPFFTTKEAGKGTGLGLATVFGIVRQHGGTVWVYSEPGIGTTFKIYFPVADRALGTSAALDLPNRSTLHGSETILLVEDEESVRVLARTILRKYGYNVLDAQSGGDAFLLCEQHTATIHLLLTDVVMPRMDGRQLAERLLMVRPEMKVLYMSGYTNDAVVRHGILDSTIAFIQKPIRPETLVRRVRGVLDSVGRPLVANA